MSYIRHSKKTSSLWSQLEYWDDGQLSQSERQIVDELVHWTLSNQIGWELDPPLKNTHNHNHIFKNNTYTLNYDKKSTYCVEI